MVATLSKNMPEEYETFIITYLDKENKYPHKGTVLNLNSKESNNFIGKVLNTLIRVYKIRKIKKKYKISKTISFLDNPNIINILSRCNDKIVISIRNQKSKEIEAGKRKLQKAIISKLYNKADEIVAISEGVKEDLLINFDLNKNKMRVIYNPIDLKYIDTQKSLDIEENIINIFNDKTIITSGRLTYQKGQWHLIKAFSKVNKIIPESNLVIMGEGELENELLELIRKLKLENNVHLLGFKSNPFKYINKAKVFVLTSMFEGFGNVITEAMASDTVVISTDCKSGPKEILNPSDINKEVNDIYIADYGVLVPVCSGEKNYENLELSKEEEIVAEAIIKVISDERLQAELKNKMHTRVKEFDVNTIVKEWCNL